MKILQNIEVQKDIAIYKGHLENLNFYNLRCQIPFEKKERRVSGFVMANLHNFP